ncbi:Uncharacterised protein [Bordetella pertussis]|nr:Uncharacterised protein [Bordetella pertussis]
MVSPANRLPCRLKPMSRSTVLWLSAFHENSALRSWLMTPSRPAVEGLPLSLVFAWPALMSRASGLVLL